MRRNHQDSSIAKGSKNLRFFSSQLFLSGTAGSPESVSDYDVFSIPEK
jgi:hypothetical protein